MEQGRVAASHALGLGFKVKLDPLSVSAVYSVPELAGVGLTEDIAKEQGIDYELALQFWRYPSWLNLWGYGWHTETDISPSRPPLTWSPYPWRHRVRTCRPWTGQSLRFHYV